MESACETCSYFQTGIEFKPTLTNSATTPANTARPIEPPSLTTSSTGSNRTPLDSDHRYNGRSGALTVWRVRPRSRGYIQMYSSAMAPSRHFATVTIRPPPSNSPTTHVHSPDPNPIG